MKRREFLRKSVYSSAAFGAATGSSLILPSKLFASPGFGDGNGKVLINTMLLGGADLRHLFVPQPNTAYGAKYWAARESIFNTVEGGIWDAAAIDTAYSDNYDELTVEGSTFGLNKKAAWLKQQVIDGNVAIVCNVKASENQRHDHSQLIVNSGYSDIDNYNFDTSGWGGRLVQNIGQSQANVVSLTNNISLYCYGDIDATNRNLQVISAPDTRNIALLQNPDNLPYSDQKAMARSLLAYYRKKHDIDLEGTPYMTILQHERAISSFGTGVETALSSHLVSQPLMDLINGTNGITKLHEKKFGQQCSGVYDSFLVNRHNTDLMKFRVASLEYGHWDTHKNQKDDFEENLDDLFGVNRSLHTLSSELEREFGGSINDDLVYTFTSDFGRQLASNGTNGTDHGKANYMIVMGNSVRGGVYGEMFPQKEIVEVNGSAPYDIAGSTIEGRTAYTRVLGEVCDWVAPGSGNSVFSGYASDLEEPNINIGSLFADAVYSVSGQITTVSGMPVYNASVQINNSNNVTAFEVSSDENGEYQQGSVQDGLYLILPSKPGYLFEAQFQAMAGADSINNFIATAQYETAISGTILDQYGEPAEGIVLDVNSNANFATQVVTDANGQFTQPVPDGLYIVNPHPNEFYSPVSPVEGSIFVTVAGSDVTKDFVATRTQSVISGTILDQYGLPAAGITLDVNDNGTFTTQVVTDANGQFTQPVNDGLYIVNPHIDDIYTSIAPVEGSVFVSVSGSDVTKDFTATNSQAVISGTILDQYGLPASGITLDVNDNGTFTTQVVTDANGQFSQPVADGLYIVNPHVNATYTSISPVEGNVFVTVAGSNVTKDFTATNTQSVISGTILDQYDQPAVGITLDINNNGTFTTQVVTDANGQYSQPVADGLYIVNPHANGTYSSVSPVEGNIFVPVSGSDVTKDFVANNAQSVISGTILDQYNQPAVGITLDINDNGTFTTQVVTDANGQFSHPVPDGLYIVNPHANATYTSVVAVEGSIFVVVSGSDVAKDFIATKA